MIIDHYLNGELHCRYNFETHQAEVHTIDASGAMFTTSFNKEQFNAHIHTLRRIAEAFDEGRHERDAQRWIDWAEENRGNPKLKAYIEAKLKARAVELGQPAS